ncbi:GMC oxidoreductase [Micromonospora sp. NBC_00617]|uniref:GMC oxidoreductase n=1 Tax=Micromonospora sp. NBC_00617 TaxID=2903587 RepID=UPI0030E3A143
MSSSVRSPDVLVVGSGFAGSWAAKELTEAGWQTLVLEAGPPRAARDVPRRFPSSSDEPADEPTLGPGCAAPRLDGALPATLPTPVGNPGQHVQRVHPGFGPRGPHLFVDDDEHPYRTPDDQPYHWIRGMQIGGRSLTWGGTALRLSRYELDAAPLDGCTLAWPVRYETLAPYYALVEDVLCPTGSREGLPQLPDSRFRHEPPALTPAEKDFREAYRPPGTHPVPVRFIPDESGREGWPRFTMQANALAAAERTGRLELRPNAVATDVTIDQDSGRATGVRYVDTTTGARHHVTARIVFLCAGTVETARLMLNSRGPRHPDGLGNTSDWVGRGLMDHPVLAASGVLDGHPPADGYEWSARQRGLMVPPAPTTGDVRPFGLWVTLQRLTTDGVPVGSIDAQGEMLPYRHNRVRLDGRTDRWGVRTPVIECAYGPHEDRLYTAMRAAVARAAEAAGLRLTGVADALTVPGLNVHDMGTARMGADPATSVVDANNACWDCPNVFVTDGACFPGGGWQNPTLTIMALSARAGRHAAGLLRDGVW